MNPKKYEKVFRDPVHDYIYIQDPLILDLIDTPEFQRLRRIKQLGTSSYVFHGAEHSRFNHSLGVYEITRRFVNYFEKYYPSQTEGDGLWQNDKRLVTLCAALLHDIGHGPFSHTFEKIFQTDHEALTIQIILDPKTSVHQILRKVCADFPQQVANVIDKTYPNQQVVQLISSQIDADRMDYLLRDAYYTGVSYGKFDLARITRVIRPYKNQIVFDYSGMHAIEDYILSRYQMHMQIYFHATSRGMEAVLQKVFARARALFEQEPQLSDSICASFKPFRDCTWSLKDYLNLDDYVLGAFFSQWKDSEDAVLADLATRFVNRHPFTSIIVQENTQTHLTVALQQELMALGFNPENYLLTLSSFDIPYDFYQPGKSTSTNKPIQLLTKSDHLVELSQASALVKALRGQISGDQRLFFPREVIEHIQKVPEEQRTDSQETLLDAWLRDPNQVIYHQQEHLF